MGYYVVWAGEEAARVVSSWAAAKAATHGVPRSRCRRFDSREAAEAAAAGAVAPVATHVGDGTAPTERDVYVDGAARLGERSAAAAFFGEADPRTGGERCVGPQHTAPRAELSALLLALRRGARGCTVWTDSAYVVSAAEAGFRTTWRANQDLLAELALAADGAGVRVRKVTGHAGVAGNEAAHRLARRTLLAEEPAARA